jgi:hypothetical protein
MSSKKRRLLRIRGSKIVSTSVVVAAGVVQGTGDRPCCSRDLASSLFFAGIVVDAVLTPAFAAWAFYNAGNRMNAHLHVLCDDLQTIVRICNQYCENIPLPDSSSSDEKTSLEE